MCALMCTIFSEFDPLIPPSGLSRNGDHRLTHLLPDGGRAHLWGRARGREGGDQGYNREEI